MSLLIIIFVIHYLVTKVKGEIAVLNAGVGFIEEDDIAVVFYITVKNICKADLELSVNMVQCCESISAEEVDCNSMTLIGGDMGVLPSTYVKNLTLLYPNLYPFYRHGVCTIKITFHNQLKSKEIMTDVHFDTSKSCPGESKQKCETPDLNFKENCNPVDCLIKYSGMINYFNPQCKLCQKVPVCDSNDNGQFPTIVYSPYSNECVDLNIPISKKDLDDIENRSPYEKPTTMINAICHYGKVTKNGECVCNDGWTTSTNDEGMYEPGIAQHHLCNIQVGSWNCVNRNRLRITAILIVVLAITIISKAIFLMCIMTWCYRYFRKPDKTCAQELDPNDPSVILCEDLDSIDKCLCCAPEEEVESSQQQQGKSLQAQTVNVSYYPCCPSAFSSNRTSTGTSQYSAKTDQTIDLTNTTTSAAISFPEGEFSDASGNTSDSLFRDDQIGDDVAYGVYCGIDDDDDDEEIGEEEEVEEEELEGEEIEEEEDEESTTHNKS